jgi:hypothetical protein
VIGARYTSARVGAPSPATGFELAEASASCLTWTGTRLDDGDVQISVRHISVSHKTPSLPRSASGVRIGMAAVAAVMVAVICGSLGACGVRPAATGVAKGVVDGVVSGIAEPCDGPVLSDVDLPAKVTIKGASGTVATQTVRGNHVYRLVVPPGHYKVSSNASGAVAVVVHSGDVAHVNLPDLCS